MPLNRAARLHNLLIGEQKVHSSDVRFVQYMPTPAAYKRKPSETAVFQRMADAKAKAGFPTFERSSSQVHQLRALKARAGAGTDAKSRDQKIEALRRDLSLMGSDQASTSSETDSTSSASNSARSDAENEVPVTIRAGSRTRQARTSVAPAAAQRDAELLKAVLMQARPPLVPRTRSSSASRVRTLRHMCNSSRENLAAPRPILMR